MRSGSTPLSLQELEALRASIEEDLGEPVTLDGLTASWSIFQRRAGHRHSTDDVMTAWLALEVSAAPARVLDLGAGIGGVGLLVLSGMPEEARLECIEVQDISYRLLRENVRANGLEHRVEAHHGDLRTFALESRFGLITGSPPYFHAASGILPRDAQRAHARFELRGDLGDYLRAARRHLQELGHFVFCFPFAQKARALDLLQAEGFVLVGSLDFVPREGLAPLFSVFASTLGGSAPGRAPSQSFVARHADGAWTEAMHQVRARFGWPR